MPEDLLPPLPSSLALHVAVFNSMVEYIKSVKTSYRLIEEELVVALNYLETGIIHIIQKQDSESKKILSALSTLKDHSLKEIKKFAIHLAAVFSEKSEEKAILLENIYRFEETYTFVAQPTPQCVVLPREFIFQKTPMLEEPTPSYTPYQDVVDQQQTPTVELSIDLIKKVFKTRNTQEHAYLALNELYKNENQLGNKEALTTAIAEKAGLKYDSVLPYYTKLAMIGFTFKVEKEVFLTEDAQAWCEQNKNFLDHIDYMYSRVVPGYTRLR